MVEAGTVDEVVDPPAGTVVELVEPDVVGGGVVPPAVAGTARVNMRPVSVTLSNVSPVEVPLVLVLDEMFRPSTITRRSMVSNRLR